MLNILKKKVFFSSISKFKTLDTRLINKMKTFKILKFYKNLVFKKKRGD